ncbi:MAG: NAD(P)H-binding protein [Chloroflexi bacterium]|nr:NAD(P)H-binding protein [Chloroflexota bacterium]
MEALSDADEAISALDSRGGGQPVPPSTTASGHVIEVEGGRNGFRYLFISAAGVKGPPDTMPFLARLPSRIIRARLGKTYLDKDAEAPVPAASSLEWVLIRPPGLTDGPPGGRVNPDATRATGGRISRDDLARFAVPVTTDPTCVRQSPFVAGYRRAPNLSNRPATPHRYRHRPAYNPVRPTREQGRCYVYAHQTVRTDGPPCLGNVSRNPDVRPPS